MSKLFYPPHFVFSARVFSICMADYMYDVYIVFTKQNEQKRTWTKSE